MKKTSAYALLLLVAAGCGADSGSASDDKGSGGGGTQVTDPPPVMAPPATSPMAGDYILSSPNGTISIGGSRSASNGSLSYRVTRNGASVLDDSPLGLTTSVADFTSGLRPPRSARQLQQRQLWHAGAGLRW